MASLKDTLVNGVISATKLISGLGFKKSGSSDNYVLLGGGGHKIISDFTTDLSSPRLVSSGRVFVSNGSIIHHSLPELTPSITYMSSGKYRFSMAGMENYPNVHFLNNCIINLTTTYSPNYTNGGDLGDSNAATLNPSAQYHTSSSFEVWLREGNRWGSSHFYYMITCIEKPVYTYQWYVANSNLDRISVGEYYYNLPTNGIAGTWGDCSYTPYITIAKDKIDSKYYYLNTDGTKGSLVNDYFGYLIQGNFTSTCYVYQVDKYVNGIYIDSRNFQVGS